MTIVEIYRGWLLRELNKKLPFFIRIKWTECAGRIISAGSKPQFADFLKFLKDRTKLVNNEFGEDLTTSSKEKVNVKQKDLWGRPPSRVMPLATGVRGQQGNLRRMNQARPVCVVCRGHHGVWRCDKFKNQSHQDRWKVVQEQNLCLKCLQVGHFARTCPKTRFRCQVEGCNKDHNTLMHPPSAGLSDVGVSQSRANQEATEVNVSHDMGGMASDEATVTAVTGADERVCFSVVPVKVLVKDSSLMPVQTYALLDSGSKGTLCHEKLQERLGASGTMQFTLSGMTGSSRVESQQIDLVVMSMDESVSVQLSNVRTVNYMPISESCIAKKEDLENWPHLSDIELQQLDIGGVMLVIGLKEKPNLFLPLECRAGEEGEPVAVRYSLGWTVIGHIGGESYSGECSANFLR